MIGSRFRLAFRIQRFEILASALLVTVVGITALIVRSRLDGVGAPVQCLTPWIFDYVGYDQARCQPLQDAFFQIKWNEAGLVFNAMFVLPFVVGLVLGVGLVGREIEGGTASTVWALAGSRRRWLTGRLVPMLVFLLGLLAFSAITSAVLAQGAVPWLFGRPTFELVGHQGAGIVARGFAGFGLAVLIGAWSGRMLPVVILSALLALFLAVGGWLLLDKWVEVSAHQFAVPSWFNGEYDGGVFRGPTAWRLPDGRVLSGWDVDPASYAPAGVDREAWVRDNVQKLATGVVSADYTAWAVTEAAVYGGIGLVLIAGTYAIVERRRPY
jgi:hypothetical protein